MTRNSIQDYREESYDVQETISLFSLLFLRSYGDVTEHVSALFKLQALCQNLKS